jgi:hypothetical protein
LVGLIGRQVSRGSSHDLAQQGYRRDRDALEWCDACIPELKEAELMYQLFDVDGRSPLYSALEDLIPVLGTP